MTLTLSDPQLRDIADKLFLLKRPAPMKLPKPVNAGPDSFTAKFAPIAADPRYKDMGIGVVDFTQGGFPKVWLHNGDRAWRIGSTCKLALHLAAVQLRDDVRELQTPPTKGLISSSADFDELFAMKKLWGLARGADREAIQQIARRRKRTADLDDFRPHEFSCELCRTTSGCGRHFRQVACR
jgi:hypothetical protein